MIQPISLLFPLCAECLSRAQADSEVQDRIDRLDQEILDAVQRSGVVGDDDRRPCGVAIWTSICSRKTLVKDIDATFEAIAVWGRLLSLSSDVHDKKTTEMEAIQCSNESYFLPMEVSAT